MRNYHQKATEVLVTTLHPTVLEAQTGWGVRFDQLDQIDQVDQVGSDMLKAMGEIVLHFHLVLTPLRFTWSFAPGQRPACSTGEVLATGAKLKKLFCPGLYEHFVDVS